MKEWLVNLVKLLSVYFIMIILFPLRINPIKKNRILFSSLTGGKFMEYSCNPKYIFEELNIKYPLKYEIVWAFAEPEKYRELFSNNIILVKHFTLKSFYYLLTSKIIITSGSYVPWLIFRKKQVIINTWHGGGAYKSLNQREDRIGRMIKKRNYIAGKNTTVFVSSSEAFSQYVIRGAFAFKGKIINIGMPRNDFLVNHDIQRQEAMVRDYFGLEKGIKIILYAPTYRDNGTYEKLNPIAIVSELEKQTGEKWVCLMRLHRYELEEIKDNLENKYIIDASSYSDMQGLLAASDILITDYSSSIWDYSFLYRPCFLYVPDLEQYKKTRGFYIELEKWHFRFACTEDELLSQLKFLDKEEWIERMEMHHKDLVSYETGKASESIVNYIVEQCV